MQQVKFKVTVDTSIIPPIFVFYNENKQITNGSVTVQGCPTEIYYTLESPGYFMQKPAINDDFNSDISYTFQDNGKTLVLMDQGSRSNEDVGLQLIIENIQTGQRYASPDPRIKNKRP
ncbi:DP-EP family protein [Gynuella sp.]|uniref:DP-EP family protein n=1 Tax=Gynuella sp. TaxID=2969146 RepID=UPI003D0F9509